MNDLLLNPYTRQQIDEYLGAPSHALILVGPAGSGKFQLAAWLSDQILSTESNGNENAYSKIISPIDGKSISIETIRDLEHFLSLKVPSRQSINRTVILENSQHLSNQAQNALLKTLEEPPAGTVLLLTVDNSNALLSTIRSRAQQINVQRPAVDALRAYFTGKGFKDDEISRALTVSGGLPGLAQSLLSNSDHPLVPATVKARELLAQSLYERLAQVDELARQRPLVIDVLFILQQMAHLSLQTSSGAVAKHWRTILNASYDASEALAANAQLKLVLCNFLLRI